MINRTKYLNKHGQKKVGENPHPASELSRNEAMTHHPVTVEAVRVA